MSTALGLFSSMDSFAVAILLGISSLLGVKSYPINSEGWRVLETWHDVGGVQQAVFESDVKAVSCEGNPSGYLEFPMIIHGAQEILLDGKKIAIFGDPKFKVTQSFYGSPVLHCKDLLVGQKIVWRTFSYSKYFARFSHFPKWVPSRPYSSFFNETLNVIAAGALVLLSIYGFLFSFRKLSLQLVAYIGGANLAWAGYFFFNSIGVFNIECPMITAHRFADLGAWLGFFLFLKVLERLGLVTRNWIWIFGILLVPAILLILFGGSGDVIQLGTSFPFGILLFIVGQGFVLQVRKLSSESGGIYGSVLKVCSLGFWIIAVLNDILLVSGLKDGYVLMSIGLVGHSFFFALALHEQIIETFKERDRLRLELAVQLVNGFKLQDEITVKDEEIKKREGELVGLQVAASLGQMAAQIAHDLRSPLAALRVISHSLYLLPEDTRALIKSAVNRINEIANMLLQQHRAQGQRLDDYGMQEGGYLGESKYVLIVPLVEEIIAEKRVQWSSRLDIEIHTEILADADRTLCKLVPSEFKRIISNLINNAVEAGSRTEKCQITVKVFCEEEHILVRVIDHGKGMPSELISKLGQRGFTFNKAGGSGLGLYHAFTEIKKWDGKLLFESIVGVGTTATIELPRIR